MNNLIQPRILKGFRDFLPNSEIQRTTLTEKITKVYRSFGFVPIDTPVLEYTEILLRKSNGETEKQVFRFEDNGGRDVAMRFDLTVPFARFTAEHKDEIYFPFKRYHVAKVWRGEKPQAGRYREFVQCDVDIVGSDSAASDFEILNVMKCAFKEIGVENITIHGRTDETSAPHIISVGFAGIRSEVLLHTLEDKGIYVSAGSACASNHPAISGVLRGIGVHSEYLDSNTFIVVLTPSDSKLTLPAAT